MIALYFINGNFHSFSHMPYIYVYVQHIVDVHIIWFFMFHLVRFHSQWKTHSHASNFWFLVFSARRTPVGSAKTDMYDNDNSLKQLPLIDTTSTKWCELNLRFGARTVEFFLYIDWNLMPYSGGTHTYTRTHGRIPLLALSLSLSLSLKRFFVRCTYNQHSEHQLNDKKVKKLYSVE